MNELSLLDSLFNDVLDCTPSTIYRAGVSTPRVDVTEDEGAYTLEMDLPGRTENDVNLISDMALSWSGVSSYSKLSSNSFCHTVSALYL